GEGGGEVVKKGRATWREQAAHVGEERDGGGAGDFGWRRNDQLELVRDDHVPAVRIAQTVARAEIAFLVAADRAGAATESIAERRQRGRGAGPVAVRELAVDP